MDVLAALRRIPVHDLRLHEAHEPGRLRKTCDSILRENMLRHPILATPMDEGYLVLDGAHRLESLRNLGCDYAPVQMIGRDQLALSAWDHLVPDGDWLDEWITEAAVNCVPLTEGGSLNGEVLVTLIRHNQPYAILLKEEGDLKGKRLSLWRQLVETYSRRFKVIRLSQPTGMHDDVNRVCIQHVICDLDEVMETVKRGEVLPAGVTRFLVEGRLLNLCIPLQLLVDHPLAEREWQRSLAHWRSHLRSYTEKVYLCEASSDALMKRMEKGLDNHRYRETSTGSHPILSAK
ncbi:ParB N-terminal domain-containing protein [Laceyella putida]|uniref:ParB N-terminal domain-containing protein n=1 Tax=Laceyella putida TaxID=110101 RepID=A0ABW2RFR0_9BACL